MDMFHDAEDATTSHTSLEVRQMEAGKKVFSERFRGSFSLLSALTRLAAHMTGLQERMKGPRYDVYGPWPVVDDRTFHAFPKM